MSVNPKEVYRLVFKDYPDVMDVKQVSQLLGVSTKTVYKLIRDENVQAIKVGREFRVPKVNLMHYMKVFAISLPE